MPALAAYDMGPMIDIRADSSVGKMLEANWVQSWEHPLDCQCRSGKHGHDPAGCANSTTGPSKHCKLCDEKAAEEHRPTQIS
jgi:hypothetical protein